MKVCIVDDVEQNARYVQRVLSAFETHVFYDAIEASEFCGSTQIDVLVTDQRMPNMSGVELVEDVKSHSPDVVAIIVSAYTDSQELIDAVNSNLVYKYVVKPFSPSVLLQHVTRGWEQANLVRENRRLRRELAEQNQRLRAENEALRGREGQFLEVFSGTHPLISELEQRARDYAATDKPVLISGETGTGKELVARALHSFSSRSDRPFLAVNCSALQESLLESQLFGYSRGAFTGADRNRQGILRAVDGGTLFLDEVGDLPLSLQPRLLRVLQFGTFIPVGETAERKVDVRILAATNRSLHREVEAGRFRRDLYYRINTLQLELLPLRERPLDIPTIMGRIAKAGGIAVPELTERAAEVLQSHPFPGNVRELQSVLDRLMIVCRRRGTHVVDVGMMRESIQPTTPSEVTSNCGVDTLPPIPPPGEELDLSGYLETMRRAVIEAVLRQEDGNISRTARRLKMSRQGLKNALLRFSATAQNGKS